MLATWRLAINALVASRGQTVLLVAATAMAVTLSSGGATAFATLTASLEIMVSRVVGQSDLQLTHGKAETFDADWAPRVREWHGVKVAAAQMRANITLKHQPSGKSVFPDALGVEPQYETAIHPRPISEGRWLGGPGELLLDKPSVDQIGAALGDAFTVVRFGQPIVLKLVGVIQRPELGVLQKPFAMMHLDELQDASGFANRIDVVHVELVSGVDAQTVIQRHASDLPAALVLQTPQSATTGVARGLAAAKMMMALMTMPLYVAAGIIIVTTMTTAVMQRLRELGILRCCGATPAQAAMSQLLLGLMLTAIGAAIGSVIGVALAGAFYLIYAQGLPGGFQWSLTGLALACSAAIGAGLLAAAYPAYLAARITPAQALAARSWSPRIRGVVACLIAAIVLIGFQPGVFQMPRIDTNTAFWVYLIVGLPAACIGYLLIAVPLAWALRKVGAGLLAKVMRVPAAMLHQNLRAMVYRLGFTAGSLMVGLALITAIWTQGQSVWMSWVQNLRLPDAFVFTPFLSGINPNQWQKLQALDVVEVACPTTAFMVDSPHTAFGIKDVSPENTLFFAVDAERFFQVSSLRWRQGDPQQARQALTQGGAIIVSEEYQQAHGLGVGDQLEINTLLSGAVKFEIVGVVASTGIDVAAYTFGIQRVFRDASMSAVFGSRSDAIKHFDKRSINLGLLRLDPDVDDQTAMSQIKAVAPNLLSGSARSILNTVKETTTRLMNASSTIGLVALLIGCLGVASLILANLRARRYDYGVLRAVGGDHSVIARLIIAETLVVALIACMAGTALGVHLAAVARIFDAQLVGVQYELHLPWDILVYAWLITLGLALIACLPAIIQIRRTQPRQLINAW